MDFQSIKEFKDNYSKRYHGEIVPILKKYETRRRNTYWLVISIWILVLLIGAYVCTHCHNTDALTLIKCCIIMIALAWFVTGGIQKNFETKIKEKIMPLLMPAFGNFFWTKISTIDSSTIRETTLYSSFEEKIDDDNFFGQYKNIDININETLLQYETQNIKGDRRTQTEFDGVLVTMSLPKNYKAHTVIRKRDKFMTRCVYEEVRLEDPEFMKMYFVDGSDQVESRYFLTTAFMERFKNLRKAFGADYLEASIKGNQLFIAIPTSKDFFSIANLSKPLNDTKQFTKLLEEFIAILSIIDELKLNQDIGL